MSDPNNPYAPRVPSRLAAQMIGVATHTLAKWRCEGAGPNGWERVSKTLVTYGVAEIEAFREARNARLKGFTPFPEQKEEATDAM